MNELIKITKELIGAEKVNAIDARELHAFLEVKKQFTDWIAPKIRDYGFVMNLDFYPSKCTATNGREMETYVISIDMAKELSMISKTEKGKQARQYFIECEKIARGETTKSTETPKLTGTVEEFKAGLELAHLVGLKDNQAVLSANIAVKKLHGIDCLGTLGVQGLIAEDKKQFFTPSVLGKKIGLSAQKFNAALESAGMQEPVRDHKNRLSWSVTDKGKPYCQVIDTNKKHTDGAPIQQVKWCEDVTEFIELKAA